MKARAREIAGGGVDVVIDPVGGKAQRGRPAGHPSPGAVLRDRVRMPGPSPPSPSTRSCSTTGRAVGVDWGGWTFKDPLGNRPAHRRADGHVGRRTAASDSPAVLRLGRGRRRDGGPARAIHRRKGRPRTALAVSGSAARRQPRRYRVAGCLVGLAHDRGCLGDQSGGGSVGKELTGNCATAADAFPSSSKDDGAEIKADGIVPGVEGTARLSLARASARSERSPLMARLDSSQPSWARATSLSGCGQHRLVELGGLATLVHVGGRLSQGLGRSAVRGSGRSCPLVDWPGSGWWRTGKRPGAARRRRRPPRRRGTTSCAGPAWPARRLPVRLAPGRRCPGPAPGRDGAAAARSCTWRPGPLGDGHADEQAPGRRGSRSWRRCPGRPTAACHGDGARGSRRPRGRRPGTRRRRRRAADQEERRPRQPLGWSVSRRPSMPSSGPPRPPSRPRFTAGGGMTADQHGPDQRGGRRPRRAGAPARPAGTIRWPEDRGRWTSRSGKSR